MRRKDLVIRFLNTYDFIIEYLFSILLAISLLKILNKQNHYIILCVLSGCVIIWNLINIFLKHEKIEKIFLKIMIPIGILYLFLILPNRVPDEDDHIYRAYSISNFDFIPSRNEKGEGITMIPRFLVENDKSHVNTYEDLNVILKQKTDYHDTIHHFNAAQTYFPTLYIFSSISFFITRILNINIFIGIYFARLFNFTVFLVFAHYALKILPYGKITLFIYMFSPIFIQQIASVSADSLINTISILYISYLLYLLFNKEKLSIKEKAILSCLTVFLTLSKYVYFPLIFVSGLLIVKKNFNKKDKKFIATLFCICLILCIIYFIINMGYADARKDEFPYEVDSIKQISFIKNNPKEFIKTLIRTLVYRGNRWIGEFCGSSLDWLVLNISKTIYIPYGIILILSLFVELDNINIKMNKFQILYNSCIFFGICFLIVLGIYISWSPIANIFVEGVQGRYFIPIAILFLLSIKNYKISLKNKYINAIIPLLIIIINSGALYEIAKFYI